jgi:hypothetical protein
MGPEIVWTFLWVSTALGVWCLVTTMTLIACGGILKKVLWKWCIRKIPNLKEFFECAKVGDDVGAMIALEQLFEIVEDEDV